MWFKRRKKTEQDDALSESLRSLQSLINDSDRREPALDAPEDRHAQDEPGQEPSVVPAANPARADTAPSAGEPAPPASGNRWQDLSLSFDAEPVVPRRDPADARARADDELSGDELSGDETARDEHLDSAELEAGVDSEAEAIEPEDETGTLGITEAVETEASETPHHPTGDPLTVDEEAEPALSIPAAPNPTVDPEHEVRNLTLDHAESGWTDEPRGPEPDTELDLETPEPAPPRDVSLDFEDTDEDDRDEDKVEQYTVDIPESTADVAPLSSASDASAEEPSAAGESSSGARKEEDQLHLELEPAEGSEDDIPTLTEAVYVPDDTSPEPTLAAPAFTPAIAEPEAAEPEAAEPEAAEPEVAEPEAAEPEVAELEPVPVEAGPAPAEAGFPPPEAESPEPKRAPSAPVEAVEPAAGFEPAESAEPVLPDPMARPNNQNVERCLDYFRSRLQLMELDPLSPAQEQELREALGEFFDSE